MKILVTGHRGILGRALMEELARRGLGAEGVDIAEMDVTDFQRVRAVVARAAPDVVIHAAAFTQVDDCETQKELCFRVNAQGVENLARAAAAARARLVYISTDYVFDGAADAPYREEALPGPLSVYGQSKLEGEWRTAAACANHLIVRSAWLFGIGGVNFVTKILGRAKTGERLAVVADQRGSPTYAGHLAAALGNLLDIAYRGVVHVAGAGVASWFDIAREILRLTGLDVPLRPLTSGEFAAPAPRPAYSALDTNRYTSLTGLFIPSWQDGLRAYLTASGELKAEDVS